MEGEIRVSDQILPGRATRRKIMKKFLLIAVLATGVLCLGMQVSSAFSKGVTAQQSMYDKAERAYSGKNGVVGW